MGKKIFRGIFLVSFISVVVCLLFVVLVFCEKYDGKVVEVLISVMIALIPAVLVIVSASYFASKVISRKFTTIINELNVDSPGVTDEYSELAPLVKRLGDQKKQISKQMDKLRRNSEEFDTLSKNMSEGLVLLDSWARVLSANPAASELFGCADIEQGNFFFDIVKSRKITDLVDSALAGDSAQCLYEKDGRYSRVIANPVNDGSRIRGVVLLAIDVTYEEKNNALRREFTANVSHELKTPLTSVYGTSEMMLQGIVAEKDIPVFAARIHSEISRMMKLINDMLRLSEIDEGGAMEEMCRTDLSSAAMNVANRLVDMAESAEITLLTESEHEVYIRGIPSVLDDIIVNLVVNAIKYNKEGGKVFVKVYKTEDGKKGVLRVEDTGIGIAKEHLGRVFERFYRVDKSRSKAVGGTGLGLSIVKNGAGLHKAELSIDSEPEKGTTVTIAFSLC